MKRFYLLLLSLFIITPSYGVLFSRSGMQKSLQVSPLAHALYRQKLSDAHLKSKDIMELLYTAAYVEKPAETPASINPFTLIKNWWGNTNRDHSAYIRYNGPSLEHYKSNKQAQQKANDFLHRHHELAFEKIKSKLADDPTLPARLIKLVELNTHFNKPTALLHIFLEHLDPESYTFLGTEVRIGLFSDVDSVDRSKTRGYEIVDRFKLLLNNDDIDHQDTDNVSLYRVIQKVCTQYPKSDELFLLQAMADDSNSNHKESPSVKHLQALSSYNVLSYGLTNVDVYRTLNNLMLHLIKKEKQLNKNFYTFVHAQRWNYQLHASWYTKLWHAIHKKTYNDFIFAHLKKSEESDIQGQLRKSILEGRSSNNDHWNDPKDNIRQKMLFMNAGLFYNDTNLGSNSTYFLLLNNNINNHIHPSLKDTFDYLDCGHLYEKYKTKLDELAKEHATLSAYGNTLLIAIPKKQINECARLVADGGYKRTAFIEGIGETEDMKLIMDTLQNNPSKLKDFDRTEFVLAMTGDKDGGLNPDSGIKFFEFNTVEAEKWAAYQTKENALFEKIKQDIK